MATEVMVFTWMVGLGVGAGRVIRFTWCVQTVGRDIWKSGGTGRISSTRQTSPTVSPVSGPRTYWTTSSRPTMVMIGYNTMGSFLFGGGGGRQILKFYGLFRNNCVFRGNFGDICLHLVIHCITMESFTYRGAKFYGLNRNYIEIMFWCNYIEVMFSFNYGDICLPFVNQF